MNDSSPDDLIRNWETEEKTTENVMQIMWKFLTENHKDLQWLRDDPSKQKTLLECIGVLEVTFNALNTRGALRVANYIARYVLGLPIEELSCDDDNDDGNEDDDHEEGDGHRKG